MIKHTNTPEVVRDCGVDCLSDVVTTANNFDLDIKQYTAVATYGLTNRVDVSVAIPILDVYFGTWSTSTIQRIGTKNRIDQSGCPPHFFVSATCLTSTKETFNEGRSAQGIGDVILRIKGTAVRWGDRAAFTLGTDVRLPTGDEYNLLGSGAVGIGPFLAFSTSYRRFSPHLDFGYQWSGKSVLAGDIGTGYKRHLPSAFPYAAGLDVGLTKRFTFDFDVLGEELIGQTRIMSDRYTMNGADFPDLVAKRGSANITNGAVGFKCNPVGSILLYFNVLFKMNDAGLRATAVPLFGITYTR